MLPRFEVGRGKTIEMEQAFPTAVIEELRRRGRPTSSSKTISRPMAGTNHLARREDTLMGGTEPRADGCVATGKGRLLFFFRKI